MRDYDRYIFKQPTAELQPLTGVDLQKTASITADTAASARIWRECGQPAPPPPAPVSFQQFGRKQRPNQRQRRRRWEHNQGVCTSSCCSSLPGIPEDEDDNGPKGGIKGSIRGLLPDIATIEDADMPPELQESDEEVEEPKAAKTRKTKNPPAEDALDPRTMAALKVVLDRIWQ